MNLTALHAQTEIAGPDTWVAPLSLSDFIAQFWCREPLVVTGSPERVARLLGRLEESAGSDIVPASTTDTIQLRTVKFDRFKTIGVGRESAKALLAAGETISVYQPDCLQTMRRSFVEAFGLPAERVGSVFLSRSRGVSPMHFDASEGFVIQLKGTKIWFIAENDTAVDPLEHADLRPEPHPSLRLHCHGPWPSQPPTGATRVEARPGTVLYLPRGMWHATESVEIRCPLTFTIGPRRGSTRYGRFFTVSSRARASGGLPLGVKARLTSEWRRC